MSIRHAVLLHFNDDATDERIAALAAGLDTMPEATGTVDAADYEHGRSLGLNPGGWDYAVVAEFASVDAFTTYRDHPAHRALIRDLLEPIVAERTSVQFDLG